MNDIYHQWIRKEKKILVMNRYESVKGLGKDGSVSNDVYARKIKKLDRKMSMGENWQAKKKETSFSLFPRATK